MALRWRSLVCAALVGGCAIGVGNTDDDARFADRPRDRVTLPDAADDLADAVSLDVDDLAPPPEDLPTVVDAPVDPPDVAPDNPPPPDRSSMCTGECLPGMARACGNCGSQRCSDACAWGPCVGEGSCHAGDSRSCGGCGMQRCSDTCAWGSCSSMGECTPGMTRACGNCGTQTCTTGCTWGSCAGQGACAPGATQAGGCDVCSQQTCQSNCTWGGCAVRPGNACEYRAGRNNRACSACRCGLQWCLPSCQWSTACTSCCTTCGGCM